MRADCKTFYGILQRIVELNLIANPIAQDIDRCTLLELFTAGTSPSQCFDCINIPEYLTERQVS